jgi:hypothetical protein
MELHVQVEGLVDLMAQVGIGAAERKNHADLDGFGLGGAAQRQSQGGYSKPAKFTHVFLPTS